MKVTGVSLQSTPAAEAAGRPSLTPELLASVGARYSRSNDGLEAILAKIDRMDLDKAVDVIFRMIDFGHQSIADMVPVFIFIDGISEILAYLLWTQVQVGSGQESSTRYIRLAVDGLIDPNVLGIPQPLQASWREQNCQAFEAYEQALEIWEGVAQRNPQITNIPKTVLDDPSDKAAKEIARMKRNFAFDRARVFLPTGVATNMVLMMPAREWSKLCQYLLSHPLLEANQIGQSLVEELGLYAPRMLKYAKVVETTRLGILDEWQETKQLMGQSLSLGSLDAVGREARARPSLQYLLPPGVDDAKLAQALIHHENRYAWIGSPLRRTMVRFGWEAVGLAEIRDLNRHRTGEKHCPLVPQGFHTALDQCPSNEGEAYDQLAELCKIGSAATKQAAKQLQAGDWSYVYWLLLGTQFPFEHNTTANKFIYEAELRTGKGAHYRYAGHLHDVLALWFKDFPSTKKFIHEGLAEPE